jgi:cytochrome c3-like protein
MRLPRAGRAAARWGGLLALGATLALASPARAQDTKSSAAEEIEGCLGCHADRELNRTLDDGSTVSLFVDPQHLAGSVHAGKLRCTDCHPGMEEMPHPERKHRGESAFRASFRDACRKCHFDNHTKLVDGMHYRVLARGDARAPSCVECHGGHGVRTPGHPRARVSQTCGKCHEGILDTYAKSVHGRALAGGNEDVPVCTDCHRAHDVGGPRDAKWLLSEPQTCGKCHSDEEKMKKYGLSTNVLKTYLADFHGTTATLALGGGHAGDGRVTALCTDCHGVHDIARVDDPGSRVVKANLVQTCQRCHPGAAETFPSAWLSHYEPSWDKAPLVHAVRLGYLFLIPFMIGGLLLQVLLHLWHVVVTR